MSRIIVRARRFLDLPSVVVLGVRRGVHHHVARLNLSRFFRLRGLPRGWENSYLGGACGERSAKTQGIIRSTLIVCNSRHYIGVIVV